MGQYWLLDSVINNLYAESLLDLVVEIYGKKAKVSTISPQSDAYYLDISLQWKGNTGITKVAEQRKPGITVLIPSWLEFSLVLS